MRAVVKAREGTGVEIKEISEPVPGPNDVIIRVSSVGICGGDIAIYNSNSSGISGDMNYPFVPGHETSGEIVKVGERVKSFAVGDRIAAETHIPCMQCYSCQQGYLNLCDNLRIFGVTRGTNGAFAEYALVPEIVAYKIPPEISPDEGAMMEPVGVGVHALSISGLRVGDSTTVLGCGPIGLYIISLLKLGGASEIIATDVSPYRLEMAQRMGATLTVNAKTENVLEMIRERTRGIGPKIVFEASGNDQALVQGFEMVAKRGKIVLVAGHTSTPPLDFTHHLHLKEASIEGIYGREIWATWNRTSEIMRHKMVDFKPSITHRFPLEKMDEAIATAKKAESGKILIVP